MKNNLFVDEEGMDIILYYNIVTESDKKYLYCAMISNRNLHINGCYMAIINIKSSRKQNTCIPNLKTSYCVATVYSKFCAIRYFFQTQSESVILSSIVMFVFIIKDVFIFNSIELERARTDPTYCLRVINPEARAALEGLYEEYKAPVS